MSLNGLRKHVGAVMQDIFLFSTSIRDNIAYGVGDASDEEIVEVAKAANAHEFIEELADGYNTNIGEGGNKLSGGQKKSIAISRSLYFGVKVLMLDEPTAGVSPIVMDELFEHIIKVKETNVAIIMVEPVSYTHLTLQTILLV